MRFFERSRKNFNLILALLTFLTLFLAISCYTAWSIASSKPEKIKDFPLPPDASIISSTFVLGKQFDETERQIDRFLIDNKYQTTENIVRRLDISTDSQKIEAFYDEQLNKLGYKKADTDLRPENATVFLWKKDGFFNHQIILLAVVENRRADSGELSGKSLLINSAFK